MQRRDFLAAMGFSIAGLSLATPAKAAGIADEYENLQSDHYLGEPQVLAKVVDDKIFTEGPCANRAGEVFFTNTQASKILKWDGRQLSVFRADDNAANGLLFDRQGRLVACEGKAGRVTRTDMRTGKVEVLVDQYEGHGLGAPNDLCFDNQGRIYFTSRMPADDKGDGNVHSVYRIDANGRTTRVVGAPDIDMPNGIVTSPDDKALYLIEASPKADQNRCILAYDLGSDGNLSNARTLINFYPGRSGDGMAIDAEGNLYVAAGLHKTRGTSETLDTRPGVHVISPAGKLLAYAQTPEDTVTNCRFGGEDLKTLYVTCGSLLLAIPTKIAGKAMYRPEQ